MKTMIATLIDDIPWAVGKPFPGTEVIDQGDGRGPQKAVGRYEGTMVTRIDVDGSSVDVWGLKNGDPESGFRITHCAPFVAMVTSECEEREWREATGLAAMNRDVVIEVRDCRERIWSVDGDVPVELFAGSLTIVAMARVQEEIDEDEEEDEEDEVEVRETGAVEVFARSKPGAPPEFLHFLIMPFFMQEVRSKLPRGLWEEMQREEPVDLDDGPIAQEPAPPPALGDAPMQAQAHLNGQPPAPVADLPEVTP